MDTGEGREGCIWPPCQYIRQDFWADFQYPFDTINLSVGRDGDFVRRLKTICSDTSVVYNHLHTNCELPIVNCQIFPYFLMRNRFHKGTMQTDIMTIREVAEYLKLKEKTAYRLVAEGKFGASRLAVRCGSGGAKLKVG